MEYEGRICRAPMERAAYMLPVTVGCSYNACKFCTLFKHLRYRELPMEQIEAELRRVQAAGGAPKRVFLGDGSAFAQSAERLLEIMSLLRKYFPTCEAVHMDATVSDVAAKSDDELRQLRESGVRCLYLGIESGLDDVLQFMYKDHSLAEAVDQIDRLRRWGIGYSAHMMTGIAGAGRGIENAEAIADFFNRTKPVSICNFSLFLHARAPLYRDIQSGAFRPADEVENLREERRLLELLETDDLSYDGFHDLIEVRIRGRLPRDREKMLAKLDDTIAAWEMKAPVFAFVDW